LIFFKPKSETVAESAAVLHLEPVRPTVADVLAAGLVPPPDAPPLPSPFIPSRPGKWVQPKGLDKLTRRGKEPDAEPKPKPKPKPKPISQPAQRAEDPEQWGQYYFRDAILDQLETYFVYLKRMRHTDPDSYQLHRRLGIHVVPQSTVKAFDNWRNSGEFDELSTWFRQTLPGFGAISYGIHRVAQKWESFKIGDFSAEDLEAWNAERRREQVEALAGRRPAKYFYDRGGWGGQIGTMTFGGKDTGIVTGVTTDFAVPWSPKFLYFRKLEKPGPDIERSHGADVYTMTVYWDRTKHSSKSFLKKYKGAAQEYAVCIDRISGEVRILRQRWDEPKTVQIRHPKKNERYIKGGVSFSIPQKQWRIPTEYCSWASGHLDHSPEDYLRRVFIEAALMYESAAMGSMVRIEVTRGNLAATFGIDVKRMAYFFKDRDIEVNDRGTRKRILHIVRPYVDKNGREVKMHFRGAHEFDWANYHVSVTVPGRDHFLLPEHNVGAHSLPRDLGMPKAYIDNAKLGDWLHDRMKQGLNAKK
jgi:hypothetical protein